MIELYRIARIEDGNWWYRDRRELLAREVRRLGAAGTAVDIGAAAGGNTRVLLDHGWRATAIDLDASAVGLARARGVDAHVGDACHLPLPPCRYDLALALDVLEHIEDDRRAAAEITRVLRPGGTALVSVPCDMALWSAHDVSLGRVRRYTRPALAGLLESAGLLVERLWSGNVLFRPFLRWFRHHTRRHHDLAPLPHVLNEALSIASDLERRLPVAGWPGAHLYARALRPMGQEVVDHSG